MSRLYGCRLMAALPSAGLFVAMIITGEPVWGQEANRVRVAYSIVSSWTTGFSAELTVTNAADWPITDWQVSFRLAARIGSIWNARVVSRRDGEYVLGPVDASWDDGVLSPGESVNIGFVASGAPREVPRDGRLNGVPIRMNGSALAPAPKATPVVAAPAWPAQVFAPYVDATAWPPLDVSAIAARIGARYFRLGFVVTGAADRPEPTWGGVESATTSYRIRQINALRRQGGDVAIVFGGATGTPLAAVAPSVAELLTAYESVIDAYRARVCEFDIEGVWLADATSIRRRAQAVSALQTKMATEGRPLEVWLTLPATPSGLTGDGLRAIGAALEEGVEVRGINVMAMDYGEALAPQPDGRMGVYAVEAARRVHGQLEDMWARLDKGNPKPDHWMRIGVTPMIGLNDVASEIFRQADAEHLVEFARREGLGLVSYWSLNRDRACVRPPLAASPACSGVPQRDYEFAARFRSFTHAP